MSYKLNKPQLGSYIDFSDPLTEGLVGWWLFNEGTGDILNDSSMNGNTGTIYNGTWVASEHGGGLSFNGTNSKVVFSNTPSLNITKSLSVEMLLRSTGNGGAGLFGIGNSYDQSYLLFKTSADLPSLYVTNSPSSWSAIVTGTSSIKTEKNMHVVGVYDSTNDMKLYVNAIDESGQTGSPPTALRTSSSQYEIGRFKGSFFSG